MQKADGTQRLSSEREATMRALISHARLASHPTAASCARLFTTHTLRRWGALTVSDDASLIVSELMTTALKATGAPPTAPASRHKDGPPLIHLGIYGHGRSVTLQVWDNSPEPPIQGRIDPEEQAEERRAKGIIEALALHAGHFFPKTGGKVAWAELAMDASAPPLANHDNEVIPNILLPHSDPRLLIRLLSGPLDL